MTLFLKVCLNGAQNISKEELCGYHSLTFEILRRHMKTSKKASDKMINFTAVLDICFTSFKPNLKIKLRKRTGATNSTSANHD